MKTIVELLIVFVLSALLGTSAKSAIQIKGLQILSIKIRDAQSLTSRTAKLAIFNMLGQRVHLSSHNEILNNKIELSVKHLARALYSIKIVTDEEQFVGKFVRE